MQFPCPRMKMNNKQYPQSHVSSLSPLSSDHCGACPNSKTWWWWWGHAKCSYSAAWWVCLFCWQTSVCEHEREIGSTLPLHHPLSPTPHRWDFPPTVKCAHRIIAEIDSGGYGSHRALARVSLIILSEYREEVWGILIQLSHEHNVWL